MHRRHCTWPGCWSRRHVSDWVDSGGDAPYFCTDDGELQDLENQDLENKDPDLSLPRRASRRKVPLTVGRAATLLARSSHLGHARDPGQYANADPELQA